MVSRTFPRLRSRRALHSIFRSVRLSFLVRDRRTLLALLTACVVGGGVAGAAVAFTSPLVAGMGLVAAVGLAVMLRSPQWGLYAVVAVAILLPFGAVPVNVGFKPTFLDGALGITFFVWFMRLAAGRVRRLQLTPLAPFVLAFMGVAMVAFVAGLEHAPLDKNTLRRFGEVMLGVSLFFVVVDHVRHRRQLEGLATVIILCGFLAALIGVVLYVLPQAMSVRLLSALRVFDYPAGPGVLRFIEDNPSLPQRAISTSVDPNVFGGLLILVTAFTAPQLAAPKPLFPRWVVVWAWSSRWGLPWC
ncbi:MAG: hypothetical protein Q9O62_04805 [Ardenticatenia bacterium]|nr:hypothetical protein [Ardenticatenia bacterium]